MTTIKIKILKPEAKIPDYSHQGDAGLNIYTCESYILKPGERHTFKTGIAIQFPEGYVALFLDRGGLAKNYGITVLGGVGDSGYRGEYEIVLLNTSSSSYEIKTGDKITQMLIQPVETVKIETVDKLDDSVRGQGAFGSTGR